MKLIIEENDDLVAHGFAHGVYEVGSCDDVVLGISRSRPAPTGLREFKTAPAEITMKLRVDVEQKPQNYARLEAIQRHLDKRAQYQREGLSCPSIDYQDLERKALAPSAREVEEKRLLRWTQKMALTGQPRGMGPMSLVEACKRKAWTTGDSGATLETDEGQPWPEGVLPGPDGQPIRVECVGGDDYLPGLDGDGRTSVINEDGHKDDRRCAGVAAEQAAIADALDKITARGMAKGGLVEGRGVVSTFVMPENKMALEAKPKAEAECGKCWAFRKQGLGAECETGCPGGM